MIESSLQALLAANTNLSALCGTRIYPLILPDSPVLPAITYQDISTDPDSTLDGPSGFMETRLQFDCWAASYGAAKQLQDALRLVLDGFSGQLQGGPLVYNVMQDTATDFYEQDSRLYRASTDYKVQFAQ